MPDPLMITTTDPAFAVPDVTILRIKALEALGSDLDRRVKAGAGYINVSGGAQTLDLSGTGVARIIGGAAANGFSIRNSANSRDNFLMTDAGTTAVLSNGTNTARLIVQSASGDLTAGGGFGAANASEGSWLRPSGVGATGMTGIAYADGTQFRSALEILSLTGFGSMFMMKGGGDVVVGVSAIGAVGDVLGYLYITTCGGTPTGVPTNASANRTAIRYDSSGHKLWVFEQGTTTWKGVVVA